jgi:hypothetical protein
VRAGLVGLAALTLASPAHACRLHTIWHFPFKQRCPVVALAPRRPPPLPHHPPSRIEISLPALNDIEWGQAAQLDAETFGRLMLRAKMEQR